MTQSNIKIAITGGIGSGKSAVSAFIKEQGYTVVSCDEIYRKLLCEETFLNKLSNAFDNILDEKGTLDRAKLSEIVFNNKIQLEKLNKITHPTIMNEALKQMSGEGLNFCEVPLLFESGTQGLFDKVIVILRDKRLRIQSIIERDNLDENQVKNRINNQFNYENATFKKYYVIHNDSDLQNLHAQTLDILNQIKNYK